MWRVVLFVLLVFSVGPAFAQGETPARTVDVPILTYHYISVNPDPVHDPLRTALAVTPTVFAQQLDWLRAEGYTTVTLDDVYFATKFGWTLPSKPVVLSFDDGYRDFYLNAWPLLRARNMKATLYLISDFLGLPPYMTPGMVQELAQSPLITIGAHTRTHPALATLSTAAIRDQIIGSKLAIEQLIGQRVTHFCYPYGSYDQRVIDQVAAAGFLTAVTTHGGRMHGADRWTWTRLSIRGGEGLAQFVATIAPGRSASPSTASPVPEAPTATSSQHVPVAQPHAGKRTAPPAH